MVRFGAIVGYGLEIVLSASPVPFVCPACRTPLPATDETLPCESCGTTYRRERGVPVLTDASAIWRYTTDDDTRTLLEAVDADGWRTAIESAAHVLCKGAIRRAEAIHLRYLARRALRMDLPPKTALGFAMRGLVQNPFAFLSDRYRGPATLAGCLAAPFLPATLRRRAFCD